MPHFFNASKIIFELLMDTGIVGFSREIGCCFYREMKTDILAYCGRGMLVAMVKESRKHRCRPQAMETTI